MENFFWFLIGAITCLIAVSANCYLNYNETKMSKTFIYMRPVWYAVMHKKKFFTYFKLRYQCGKVTGKYFSLRLLVFFILFTFLSTQAQEKRWFQITGNDYALIGTSLISGTADAYNQLIIHHHFGRGNKFWDADISWKNKYKDFDHGDLRPAFWGSKTIFVGLTDGYHLTRTINRAGMTASVIISVGDWKSYPKKDRIWVVLKKAFFTTVPDRIIYNLIFN